MIDIYYGEFLVSPAPLEMSLNYCSHKCGYCFANLGKPDREANPKAIMSLLANYTERKTLTARLLQEGYPVVVSNRTDPFATSNYQTTVPILRTMVELGIPIVMQTKGGRGIDEVLDFLPPSVWYISVSFDDDALRRKLEPGAPTLESRFELMRTVKARGHSVVVGLNPLVPEWLPDPMPILERVRDIGVSGVWIETLHMNRDQEANLTDRERKAITQPLIDRAKRRGWDESWKQAFFGARDAAQSLGMEVFSIGQTIRSEFFAPYRACYSKTFPVMQDFVNACHDKIKPRQDEITFGEFADFMSDRLPEGEFGIGGYLFRADRISSRMTYKQLLAHIWKNDHIKQCPVRIDCFAWSAKQHPDGWELFVDENDMPYLVFSQQNFSNYYAEVG